MADPIYLFLYELGAILIIATVLGLVAKRLKQPIIIAYILTGIIVGPSILNIARSGEMISVFAHLGVAFLLFLVGLNMNYKVLREVGKISIITGAGQIAITFILGYIISLIFGFAFIPSFIIAISLTFSSTIVIVKLLSDKNDLDSLYGKISIGFLLVQDFAAIAIIVMLSSGNVFGMGGAAIPIESLIMINAMKIVFLFAVTFVFGKYILPPLIKIVSKSTEVLFLAGISWMFVMSMLSMYMGFTVEIGALLAGISMASLPYHFEITGRIKPLRDFFLILFFVALGVQIPIWEMGAVIVPAIVLSIFVLFAKPIIIMILMGLSRYKKRTGFLVGVNAAQISEFSFIIAAMAMVMTPALITSEVSSMIMLIGLITIAVSSYMIFHNNKMYTKLAKYLDIFERKKVTETLSSIKRKTYDVVVIGYHRMGYTILRDFKNKSKVLVVDFNPTIIDDVKNRGFCCEYGDVSDPDLMERILRLKPKLIISTVPNYDDNMYILKKVREREDGIMVFVTTNSVSEALEFYKKGADYVIVPHFLGGEKAAMLLGEFANKDVKDIKKEKEHHTKNLNHYAKMGHKHI